MVEGENPGVCKEERQDLETQLTEDVCRFSHAEALKGEDFVDLAMGPNQFLTDLRKKKGQRKRNTDEEYDSIDECVKSKRIRAKNGGQAIKIFQQKYPELEIIGWR